MHYFNIRDITVPTIIAVSLAAVVQAQPLISVSDRLKVNKAMAQVEGIARASGDCEQVGEKSMRQSSAILSVGAPAVYALSPYAEHPDWKVRFWVADMLGYLNNADAGRPLSRMINNGQEKGIVKERARRSLRRLGTGWSK